MIMFDSCDGLAAVAGFLMVSSWQYGRNDDEIHSPDKTNWTPSIVCLYQLIHISSYLRNRILQSFSPLISNPPPLPPTPKDHALEVCTRGLASPGEPYVGLAIVPMQLKDPLEPT